MSESATMSQQAVQIKPLTSHYLPAAASLLYQSYYDDPLLMEIFKADKPDYGRRLRAAIAEEVNGFFQAKEHVIGLFNKEQLLGVCCLVSPDFGMSVGRFWHWRLKMLLTAGFMSTKQLIEKEEKLREAISHSRYHMISFIAIAPNHQQHGLGQQLLRHVAKLVEQDATSSGVGVFVTIDGYRHFFTEYNFDFVADVTVGYVKGQLMFRSSLK